MKPSQYRQIPLSEDEKDLLLTIYQTRVRLFFTVYIILTAFALAYGFYYVDSRNSKTGKVYEYWEKNDDARFVSRTGMWMINFSFIELMLSVPGIFIVYKSILPFRKDIKSGMKDVVPYTIREKRYFALVDKYYFMLHDPHYPSHETDRDTFGAYEAEEVIDMYRARYSRYVFEVNDKFRLL